MRRVDIEDRVQNKFQTKNMYDRRLCDSAQCREVEGELVAEKKNNQAKPTLSHVMLNCGLVSIYTIFPKVVVSVSSSTPPVLTGCN